MAQDATGTPSTNWGIPKFNTAVDPPTGKGTNAMIDFIDGIIIPDLLLDAKGDLIVATAADVAARLAVGADDTVLTADSSQASGLRWAAAAGADVAYGTSLPGSPADGDEAILVDSTTAPTYQWRFRYNAGSSSAHKWEFVGGAPAHVRVDTAEARASTSYGALTTAGPSFTVPVAGDYDVTIGVQIDGSGTQASGAMSYSVGGTGASDVWAAIGVAQVASLNKQAALSRLYRHLALAASTALVAQYRSPNAADSITYRGRSMHVVPVRVG